MNNLYIKYSVNPDDFYSFEILRSDSYGLDVFNTECSNSYLLKIVTKRMVMVGLYKDDLLIGGCYVSRHKDCLIVEQLFVSKCFQNKGLRLGRYLLEYVISNKKYFDDYFDKDYNEFRLFPKDDKTKKIYKKIGFSYEGCLPYMKKNC